MAFQNPFAVPADPVIAIVTLIPTESLAVRRLKKSGHPGPTLRRHFPIRSADPHRGVSRANYYGGSTSSGRDGFVGCDAYGAEPGWTRSLDTRRLIRLDPSTKVYPYEVVVCIPDGTVISRYKVTSKILKGMVRKWSYDDDFDPDSKFASAPLCALLELEDDSSKISFHMRDKRYRREDIDYVYPIDIAFCEISNIFVILK